jgi:riboflavin synthase
MFTGIVQFTGILRKVIHRGDNMQLEIEASGDLSALKIGDSIAIDGVCLTVVEKGINRVVVDVAKETITRTTLKSLRTGDVVNLELPLTPSTPLGGHIVQGHVDCTGRIVSRRREGNGERITIEIPQEWNKYIVEKGSIAVDGMSLTVAKKSGKRVEIAIIPHTLKNTNISLKKTGSYVNIEVDVIGKYVYNFLKDSEVVR